MKYEIVFFIFTFFATMEIGISRHFGHFSKNKIKKGNSRHQFQANSVSHKANLNFRVFGGSEAKKGNCLIVIIYEDMKIILFRFLAIYCCFT